MIPLGIDQIQIDNALPLMAGVRAARFGELDAADRAAWARLSAHSGADSIYACDWFVAAVLAHFDAGERHRLFIAVDALGDWYGVAVLTAERQLGRVPLSHWRGIANPNQFLGLPLVRKGREMAFWRALFAALDWQGQGQAALCFGDLPVDHRVTRALFAQAQAEGRLTEVLDRRQRAALLPGDAVGVQLATGLSSKRQCRLRSLDRKLEREQGAVHCVRAEGAAATARWIEDFLALEAAGWKGRAGSALACSPDTSALFRDVVGTAAARGAIVCLSIAVGGKAIAMTSFFLADGQGFGFKCCFDEDYASYAPGLLLLNRIMADADAMGIAQFDSCSAPGEATINGLWTQRREMLDVAVALQAPLAALRFDSAMKARQAWRWWKARGFTSPAVVSADRPATVPCAAGNAAAAPEPAPSHRRGQ